MYIYGNRENTSTTTYIEVYIEVFAPCGFSATYIRVYCWVTVDSYAWRPPVNETKIGDSRERSRQVFRKETLPSPNFLQRRFKKTRLRKAIYLERMGRTLNGFPFQRITFLFNVKLAYRCDTALTSRVNRLRDSLGRGRKKGSPPNPPPPRISLHDRGNIVSRVDREPTRDARRCLMVYRVNL